MKSFGIALTLLGCLLLAGCGAARPAAEGQISAPVPVSGPPAVALQKIDMLDARTGWGITAETGRLLHTFDGGSTWEDVTPAVEMVRAANSSFPDAQTAYVEGFDENNPSAANGVLYTTQDAGRTWSAHSLPFAGGSLQFLDAAHGYALAVPWGTGADSSAAAVLYRTQDGGVTWSQAPLNDPSGKPPAGAPPSSIRLENGASLAIHDPQSFFLGGGLVTAELELSLQASWDAGQTWQALTTSLPSTEDLPPTQMSLSLPVFLDQTNGFFTDEFTLTNEDGGNPRQVMALFASHDGGRTWRAAPSMVREINPAVRPVFLSPRDVLVLCGQAICATQDGGSTWKVISSNVSFGADRALTQLDFLDSQTGWAATTSGLYRTSDGGQHWDLVKISVLAAATTPTGQP